MFDDIYSFVAKNVFLFPISSMVGYKTGAYFKEFLKSQYYTAESIKEYQKNKISPLLKIAYTGVPYYKDLFKNSLSCPAFNEFPIVDKNLIREIGVDQFKNSLFKGKFINKSSSGSTGEPFQYFVDKTWKGSKIASWLRMLEWTGYRFGYPYVNVTGFPHGYFKKHPGLFKLEQRLSRLHNLSPFDLNVNSMELLVHNIKKQNVNYMRGYASSVYEIAKFVHENNIDLKLKSIITTGETLFQEQREIIETAFGAKVFDQFGGDVGDIAGQCEYGNYHISAENSFVEIVDDNSNPVKSGEEGQIVVTALNLFAFPLIRYNTKDIGALSDVTCKCGRGLPVMKNIKGRLSDRIITGSGKIITTHMFTGLFMPIAEVDQFMVIQKGPDHFIFEVKPNAGYNDAVRQKISGSINRLLGPGVEYSIQINENIGLNSRNAKRRFFIKDF